MKSVLLISIVFPPEAGGGTIRAAKLAKYLPLFGWRPSVLTTTPPHDAAVVSPSMDHLIHVYRSYRCDIAEGVASARRGVARACRIFRNTSIKTRLAKPAAVAPRGRLADKFLIPDAFLGWVPGACLMALRAVSRENVQVVYSTAPTPTAHLVGWFLKSILGVRWVIEFRDPWLRNPFRRPRPLAWMERLEKMMERSVVRAADHIVVTSREYLHEFLEDYPEIPPSKMTFIPNGFDPEDFIDIEPKRFDRWTIVHAGNFYTARSARPFLEALDAFFRRRPSLRNEVQVRLVGNDDAETRRTIDVLALGDVVMQIGSVPHRESIAYMLGADVLLLIPGPGRGTMPGKTFEYLAARKPILALADEGTVRELVEETGAGIGVDSGDLAQIADALERLFEARKRPFSASAVRDRYDRRNIAEAVARLLDDVVAQTAPRSDQVARAT